ncbi:hypothetical protein WMY93_015113 [Mugilogobius chulae]|uniref:SRCR domain-containing protein n=1 Tax=Mugilogobius chulae TaxID=88201 RepID=A0AAW0NYS1_9GOBI
MVSVGINSVEVRLVNGGSRCSGYVEAFVQRQWGGVCSLFWDLQDAQVVCRQLGCGKALYDTHYDIFGKRTYSFWMNLVQCTGEETELARCPHLEAGGSDCNPDELAGVICEDEPNNDITEMRLIDGGTNCSGRVEVLVAGLWGSVCSSSWDLQDAQVVCRQMGCGKALSAPVGFYFGDFWMGNVACTGDETELSQCGHSAFGEKQCYQAASVICEGPEYKVVLDADLVSTVPMSNEAMSSALIQQIRSMLENSGLSANFTITTNITKLP